VKTTSQEGTVKFVGGIHFKSGTWVGIELFERGAGKNNGTIKGVTYFKCPEKTGLLVMASSVNVMKPAQKIITNSQKASLVSKTIYKQTKKPRKSVSYLNESSNPTNTIDNSRKIKTLPRTTKAPTVKVKPRPKSTQVDKSSYLNKSKTNKKLDRPPAQTNININMTMTTSPKEKSIFHKNRINPNSSMILLPNCEVDAEISDDSNIKNINDTIINGLQNTLVHLKDIVTGLADEYVKEGQENIPLIKATVQQENEGISQDGIISTIDNMTNTQDDDSFKEKETLDNSSSEDFSSSSIPLNKRDNKNRMVKQSLKQVTDSQRTISELSIGLVNAQQEVRKLKDNQTNLNRELNYYKEENKSLIERVADLEKQNKSLSALSSKDRYLKDLEMKNKKLNIEYEQVKNELFFAKKNIEELYRKLEYNDSPKSLSLYNKYSNGSDTRIARHKTFANSKRNIGYSNMYRKSKNIKDNGSSEFSYNSDAETKINDTILDMKEQNEKLILENETLHEEMEMLKNTLLDVQEDRENSSNHFLEKMEYQEKKYEDLKLRYHQVESEKAELLDRIKNISGVNGDIEINLTPVTPKAASTSSTEDAMIAEMKDLIADMEVTLNKTVESEKEARSNFDAVNKLYEASKVKMEALKQELEQRKMDYQLLSESNEKLNQENIELKQTLEEMNQKQSESSTNEELQEKYDQLKKQLEASKAIIEDKEAEMINYDVQCSQLEGQIVDFEKQLSMKQNEINCLSEKFQVLEKAHNGFNLTENEKDNIIHDQANKICNLEESIKEYKDENNLLKINNEENINEISKLNKMKSDLEIEMTNKENELERRKNLVLEANESANMKQEIQEKNNQIEELIHKNSTLSVEIKESNEKFIEIQAEKEKVDKELEELNGRMLRNTQELESLTLKYEEDKKQYEKEIDEINKDRDNSVQHAKEEIEDIINQLTDARKQFEIKVNQLENSKEMMQKEYETEIEDLNRQLELLANLQQQTEQAENLLELSTLLDESERAKEVAESNAENRRKLLEKVIVERDQLSQDLQSEKEKFLTLKDDYEQCKQRIKELEKEDLAFYVNKGKSLSNDNNKECNNCEKLKKENTKLKEEIEELGILKTIDVQEIDKALKQSSEDIQKVREEKEMLENGYALIWNSYLNLEKECQKLLDQINENATKKEDSSPTITIHETPATEKAQSESSRFRSNFSDVLSPKNKMNITFDSIQDYTYDFDYDSVPDTTNTNILNRELKEDPIPSSSKENAKGSGKRINLKTNSNSDNNNLSSFYYSPRQDAKDKAPMSTISESSSNNTLYSPKRRSSFNTASKYQSLPRINHRIKGLSNYKSQSVILEAFENNDDTLYHKPEDESDLINYSSILQKSKNRTSTIYSNNKFSYHN
jgi:hypothetical protein